MADTNFEFIDEICNSMQEIIKNSRKKFQETQGTMNIIEIMNWHYLENQHSNVLAFLLNPEEKHHHPEYEEKIWQKITLH